MSIGSFKPLGNRVKKRPQHTCAIQSVLSYSKQRRPRMCDHCAQTYVCSFSGLRSSLYVWAGMFVRA